MPRNPAVPPQDILNLLKTNRNEIENNIKKPSNIFWTNMSKEIGGQLSARALYTIVKTNRYNCCDILNITLNPLHLHGGPVDEVSDKSGSDFEGDTNVINNHFLLSSENWKRIEPENKIYADKKNRLILQRGWTDILNIEISNIVRSNCVWKFKNHNIYQNGDYFLTIQGTCLECGASLFAFNTGGPTEDMNIIINFKITNLNTALHTGIKKRKLTGSKRNEIGQSLSDGKLAINWKREEAYRTMNENDKIEPSILYSLDVLRKCKQEYSDKKFSILQKTDDPVNNLQILKYTQPYLASIHRIGLDKFFIHYWSPEQMSIYNSYVKNNYKDSLIAIDATGTLVNKLRRPYNYSSGHIFLYTIVIHINKKHGQIPVSQMFSESHDANNISFWLNSWIKLGACIPQTIVCDHSLALLSAISWAFTNMTLKTYITHCFKLLNGEQLNIPQTYIRIDYNHIMKIICKWESIRKPRLLHDFYARAMNLVIKATSLEQAGSLIESLIIVANSEYSGNHNNLPTPCELHKQKLKTLISGLDVIETDIHLDTDNSNKERMNKEISIIDFGDTPVNSWFANIKETALKQINNYETEDENFHYCPDFIRNLEFLVKTILLWSSIMNKYFMTTRITASSAIVESYFNDLKNRTFKCYNLPIRIDKFIVIHFESIQGMMKLANTVEIKNEGDENCDTQTQIVGVDTENIPDQIILPDDTSAEISNIETNLLNVDNTEKDGQEIGMIMKPPELINKKSEQTIIRLEEKLTADFDLETKQQDVDNWKRKATERPKKFRKCKNSSNYGRPCPEVLHVKEGKKIKLDILQNGLSIPKCLIIEKQNIRVLNTCAFDAVTQAVAAAFCDSSEFNNFLNNQNDIIAEFIQSFVTVGAKLVTYKLRAKILFDKRKFFKTNTLLNNIYQIDCECNAVNIITHIFNNYKSAHDILKCSSSKCNMNHPIISMDVIPINIHILNNNFSTLVTAIDNGILKTSKCKCGHNIQHNIDVSENIFIDTNGCGKTILSDITYVLSIFNKNFILRSVIHFEKNTSTLGGIGHYICYSRRIDAMWELYNDFNKKVLNTQGNTEVEPHLLFYTV